MAQTIALDAAASGDNKRDIRVRQVGAQYADFAVSVRARASCVTTNGSSELPRSSSDRGRRELRVG